MRTLARELKDHVGKVVEIQGWIHKKRLLGGITFINVRDRSGLVQAVVEDKQEVEKLRGLQIGTILKVSGKVKEEPRAPGGAELHDPKITVIVPVEDVPAIEIDKPIDHRAENLDTLFENRVLNIRNLQEQNIFKIRAGVNRQLREFLTKKEFVEIQTPKLVAGAAEGGAEVFKLDYFGQEATLAQSPQLYKQIMVGAFERVFEIGPAFRAELSATTRHMSEVSMLDIEFGFINDHGDVLDMVQDMVHDTLKQIYKTYAVELKSLNAPTLIIKSEFPRYSMQEIHDMYGKANKVDMSAEEDLTPDEERWICEFSKKHHGSELVFATDLPASKMKFYHMANEGGKTAKSADLLFRGVEIATCPMREHRYERLVSQMKKAGVDIDSSGFKYYLQAFKAGLPPHGGCGFGIDRFVEKIIGLRNVKEATLFPRDINRLAP